MSDLLLQASDEFGILVSVTASSEFPPGRPEAQFDQFDEWCFHFDDGRFCVGVDRDFDTVVLTSAGSVYEHKVPVTDHDPFRSLVGCRLRWGWLLTNQRGYTDGVQLEFARDRETWILQLVAEASSLRAYSLAGISHLSNLG